MLELEVTVLREEPRGVRSAASHERSIGPTVSVDDLRESRYMTPIDPHLLGEEGTVLLREWRILKSVRDHLVTDALVFLRHLQEFDGETRIPPELAIPNDEQREEDDNDPAEDVTPPPTLRLRCRVSG